MRVLVIGSGAREHALVWKLRQSPRVSKIYCAPGNGGIADEAECLPADIKNLDSLLALAHQVRPDLTVIAPWREWDLDSRTALMDFARRHDIPVPVTAERPYSTDRNLLHICCTSYFCFQLLHGVRHYPRHGLDIAPLRRADIFVTQDCLDHFVRHSEFVQIRGKAPAISVPAFPLQAVRPENGFDHTISEVVQIQRPANRVREHPAGSIFWLDGVERNS